MDERATLITGLDRPFPDPALARSFGAPDDRALASLGEMLAVLKRYKGRLLLWVLFCLAIAGLYLHAVVPQFKASTLVLLEPPRSAPTSSTPTLPPGLDSAQADSQMQVIKSERVLSIAFDMLDLVNNPEFAQTEPTAFDRIRSRITAAFGQTNPLPAGLSGEELRSRQAFDSFVDRIGTRRIGQSYVIETTYTSNDPQRAARLANAITAAYILNQVNFRAAVAKRGAEYLQGRISDIQSEQEAAETAVRSGTFTRFQFPDSDARIISAAQEPLRKSYPQGSIVLGFGLCFGLLTGIFTVVALNSFDRTIRTGQQLTLHCGLLCLGVIPRVRRRATNRIKSGLERQMVWDDRRSAYAEALRATRTALRLGSGIGGRTAIGLVSWTRGVGKSTLAGSLAQTVALSGSPTTLVDCDMANPTLSHTFVDAAGVENLAEHLLGGNHPREPHTLALGEDLDFIPASNPWDAPDPDIYLGSKEMRRLLDVLQASRNIILDLPAMNCASNAQAIGPLLDGVIIVVESGVTSIDDVQRAISVLNQNGVHIFGALINKDRFERNSTYRRTLLRGWRR